MKTYINPNKIIKADIREPAEGYETVLLGLINGNGWQLIVILEGNEDVIIECSSEEECIAWCNSFNLIQVK